MEDPVTARIRQLEKKDRAEQVSTKLVEGQVKEEVAELRSRRIRNDVKLPMDLPARRGRGRPE